VAERVRKALQNVSGEVPGSMPGIQLENGYHSMVSEDMSYMMEKVPGCYIMVGSANAEKGLNYGHHHPRFDFDEAALPIAVSVMTSVALEFLNKQL
jgi:amidohydrolase